MFNKVRVIILILSCSVIIFAIFFKGSTSPITKLEESPTPKKKTTSNVIVNPARERCSTLNGTLKIQKLPYGAQYGLCYFEDNKACEEWSLFRGECPVGGVKTTGYDTIDQKYCAWRGGKTIAEASSTCTFRDGRTCKTIDLYNGKCKDL